MTFDPLESVAGEYYGVDREFLERELRARGVDPDHVGVRIADGRAEPEDLASLLEGLQR